MEIGYKMVKPSRKTRFLSAILIGTLFAVGIFIMDYWIDGGIKSFYGYLFQGILFGIWMGFGLPYLAQRFGSKGGYLFLKNIKPDLVTDEHIESEGPASLFRGMESVGGKLFLTNQRAIFKAHKMNIQTGQTNIPFENISEISLRKTAHVIENGLRIKMNSGEAFDFVLNERETWIEKLNEKLVNF
tara:strand:- start:199 stop:756 length:558 start_codon:yes stop_codon:yes gene_type:complete